jgi:hypothetical protein
MDRGSLMIRLFGPRVRAALAVTVLVGVAAVVVPASAGAASTLNWSMAPSATQQFAFGFPGRTLSFPQYGNAEFKAVSCVSARFCVAIGTYSDQDTSPQTLIEFWNGKAWSIAPRSAVEGASPSAVSCTSASFCVVVGRGPVGTGNGSLIERWNGVGWTLDVVPATAKPSNELSGVSCISKISCVAVGSQSDGSVTQTLVESWSGVAWSVVGSPNVGALASSFSSVTCTGHNSCFAAGAHNVDATTAAPLIERWNGTTWAVAVTPAVTGSAILSGVSCTSADVCVAVGGAGASTLAERLHGTTWSVTPSPRGNASQSVVFTGVSCTSAKKCVGTVQSLGPTPSAASGSVYAWDGTTWARGQGQAGTGGGLRGVSCANKNFCSAVGGESFPSQVGTVALIGRS